MSTHNRFAPDFNRRHIDIASASIYVLFCMPYMGRTHFKVGMSEMVYERLLSMSVGCPFPYARCAHVAVPGRKIAYRIEAEIHAALKPFQTKGEWFQMECDRPESTPDFKEAVDRVIRTALDRDFQWQRLNMLDYARFVAHKTKGASAPRKRIRPADFTSAKKQPNVCPS